MAEIYGSQSRFCVRRNPRTHVVVMRCVQQAKLTPVLLSRAVPTARYVRAAPPSRVFAPVASGRTFSTSAAVVANDERGHPAITFKVGSPNESLPDAFALVESTLKPLAAALSDLVASPDDMPQEGKDAQAHFFVGHGKHFRPTICLLAAAAANGAPNERQARLAQIVEIVHAASLLHDDVIDLADTRRGTPAVHKLLGNKVAVLSGDFLIARANRMLAELGSIEAVTMMATVFDEMVAGEMMQLRATPQEKLTFDHYLHKSYRKTAALISLGCKATAVLGDHSAEIQSALEQYGRHLGLAYQIIDDRARTGSEPATPLGADECGDPTSRFLPPISHFVRPTSRVALELGAWIHPPGSGSVPLPRAARSTPAPAVLDITGSPEVLGKPTCSDMRQGLATAPALFAHEEFPELGEMIMRSFSDADDVRKAEELIRRSRGLERTMELAVNHAERAAHAIGVLPPSTARDGLLRLLSDVLNRKA